MLLPLVILPVSQVGATTMGSLKVSVTWFADPQAVTTFDSAEAVGLARITAVIVVPAGMPVPVTSLPDRARLVVVRPVTCAADGGGPGLPARKYRLEIVLLPLVSVPYCVGCDIERYSGARPRH